MSKELQSKVFEAINSLIVGNVVFSDEELSELYEKAEELIPKISIHRGIVGNPSLDWLYTIFVAFVNACKDWGSTEDCFYDFLDKKISGTQVSRDFVVALIDYLNDKSSIYTIKEGKRYYATMLSHSLSPLSSTISFFEMCWEIYCKDLCEQYTKNDPVIELIIKSLQKKFQGRNLDDNISIGSNVYCFRIGLIGLLYSSINTMRWLLDDILGSIDSLFNNEPLNGETYIHALLKEWWSQKSVSFGEVKKRRRRGHRETVVSDYSQIKAKYVLDDGQTKLIIPAIRLVDDCDCDPEITIYSNGEEVVKDSLPAFGSGIIGATTQQREFLLEKLGNKNTIAFRAVITHCNKVIYDSSDSLYRDFIVFKDGREVTSLECVPGYYFLYAPFFKGLLRYPREIRSTNLNTYGFEATNGDVLQSEHRTMFFVDERTDRDLYFYLNENNGLVFRRNSEEYKVIDGELCIDVKKEANLSDIGVRYEDASFKLTDFPRETLLDKERFAVSKLLNVGEPQKLSVFRYSDDSIIARINLIKFNNINATFDKPLYYGKNEAGIFVFKTEKYYAETAFNIEEEEVSVFIEGGEIVAKPPVLRWKIDSGDWQTQPMEKGLWFRAFTNSSVLTIDLPKELDCVFALTNNEEVEKVGNKHEYKLGQTIYSLSSKPTQASKSILAFVRVNNQSLYEIGNIHFKEEFLDLPLVIDSIKKELLWNPYSFIGDDDAKFELFISFGEKDLGKCPLSLKPELVDLSDYEDGTYCLRVNLLGKGFLQKSEKLYDEHFFLGNEKAIRFKNKMIVCDAIKSFELGLSRKEIVPFYIDNIKYIGTIDGLDTYSGYLFVIDMYGKRIYLEHLFDEGTKEYKDLNPLRIQLKGDKTCYIGYGLDLEDGEYEYDDEFSLSCKNKIAVGSHKHGMKNLSIDYYYFGVKNNV